MSESKSKPKAIRVALGNKNKIIFSYMNGKLQGTLMITDKSSISARKSEDAVFLNIDIPMDDVPKATVFFTTVLMKYIKVMKASKKKSEAVDIDEVLGSEKSRESENIISLME